jgi:hypothetical protein
MGTPYEKLYNRALARITDPLPLQLPEEELENMLHDWLMDAIAEPMIGEYDFDDRNDELKQFNFNISNVDQKIIAIHMARAWLAPQITSIESTLQVFSGKETHFYSQEKMLAEKQALDEKLRKDADLLFCRGTYTNNDFFD